VRDGTLLRDPKDGTIVHIQGGTRYVFRNWQDYVDAGYEYATFVNVPRRVIEQFPARSFLSDLPAQVALPSGPYGVNYPNGVRAVEYIYHPLNGMFRPLEGVEYLWNRYEQWATDAHPFNPDALRLYADGNNMMTARDANGHLLLDFDHDGELDVSDAGSAFYEHNGRGAGDVARGQPYSVFWYDDNWLARYMAQAYSRPLPDGLSDYSDFTRWKIIGGDIRNWTPYEQDHFDQLALDGLYYVAADDIDRALIKWLRMREKNGGAFDPHSGLFLYPQITENYYLGLFKILTDRLLAESALDSNARRELLQHSVSLRAAIVENQERSGSRLTGWTSDVEAGTSLMNTESLAVNVLALATAAKMTFGAGEPPLRYQADRGYTLSESRYLSALEGSSRPGHMTFGPYFSLPAGSYTLEFVMRAGNPADPIARLDIYDAQSGRVLAERDVTSAELGTGNQWTRAALRVNVPTTSNQLEFRCWWYGNSNLDVAEIRLH
jgi:hypothetical protein